MVSKVVKDGKRDSVKVRGVCQLERYPYIQKFLSICELWLSGVCSLTKLIEPLIIGAIIINGTASSIFIASGIVLWLTTPIQSNIHPFWMFSFLVSYGLGCISIGRLPGGMQNVLRE